MRWLTGILVILVVTSLSLAQTVELPAEQKGKPGEFIRVAAKTDCSSLNWYALDPGLNLFPIELLKDTKTAVVTSTVAGTYRLMAYGAKGDKATFPAICTVIIGDPLPPVPPGPTPVPPGPTPVPPGPTPGPSPIPVAGLRVLIVYESAEVAKMPAAQQGILFNRDIRDFLNSNCVMGPDGRTKEWRIFDKDVDASADSDLWSAVMKRDRKIVPWIVISNHPTGGYEGPLPENTSKTMELIKKYMPVSKKK